MGLIASGFISLFDMNLIFKGTSNFENIWPAANVRLLDKTDVMFLEPFFLPNHCGYPTKQSLKPVCKTYVKR